MEIDLPWPLLLLFGEDEIAFDFLANSDVDKRPSVMVKKTPLL